MNDHTPFAGKRCLITGGSRGVGRALGEQLTRAGAKVAFTYRRNVDDAEQAAEAMTALGAQPHVFRGNVADSAHVRDVVRALISEWGGLDALVNNAGINQMYPLALVDEADFDEVMAVNVKGAFLFSRAVAKHMLKARAGAILNLGSFASERLVETPVHYAAAKSALRGMTDALALELGRYNVRVNLLAPGVLDAGLSSMLPQHRLAEYLDRVPAGRVASAEEIAQAALFFLSDDASFLTGAKIALDGGL